MFECSIVVQYYLPIEIIWTAYNEKRYIFKQLTAPKLQYPKKNSMLEIENNKLLQIKIYGSSMRFQQQYNSMKCYQHHDNLI